MHEILISLRRIAIGVEEIRLPEPTAGSGQASELRALRDELDELVRSRALWEAEIEARNLKADSTLKAARAAEERARGMERRAHEAAGELGESDGPGLEELAAAWRELLSDGDGEGGGIEEMSAMREVVEMDNKAVAMRAKWLGGN